MHDEMLTLFDSCVTHLTLLRSELASPRRVEPGERRATVQQAIAAAERFATSAAEALAESARQATTPGTPAAESGLAVSSLAG